MPRRAVPATGTHPQSAAEAVKGEDMCESPPATSPAPTRTRSASRPAGTASGNGALSAALVVPAPALSEDEEEDEDALLASPPSYPLLTRVSARTPQPPASRLSEQDPASGIVGAAKAFAAARRGRLRLTDVLAEKQRTDAARAAVAATREEVATLMAAEEAAKAARRRPTGGAGRAFGFAAAGRGGHINPLLGAGGGGDSRDGAGSDEAALAETVHSFGVDGLLLGGDAGGAGGTGGAGGGAAAGMSWEDSQDGLPLDAAGRADPILVAARRLARDGCVLGGVGGVTIDAAADRSPRQVFVAPLSIPAVSPTPPPELDHPLADFFRAAAGTAASREAPSADSGDGEDDSFSGAAAMMFSSCVGLQPPPALATWLLHRVVWPPRGGGGADAAAAVLADLVSEGGGGGGGIGWPAVAAVLESYGAVLEVAPPPQTPATPAAAAAKRVADPSTLDGAVERGLPAPAGGGAEAAVALRRLLGLAARSLRAAAALRGTAGWVMADSTRGGSGDRAGVSDLRAVAAPPVGQEGGALAARPPRSPSAVVTASTAASASAAATATVDGDAVAMEMDTPSSAVAATTRRHVAAVVWEPAPWRAEADVATAITTAARLLLCSTGATLLGPSLQTLIVAGLDWYTAGDWPSARARLAAATAADLTGPDPECRTAAPLHAVARALPAVSHRSIAWTAAVSYEVLLSLGRRPHGTAGGGKAIGAPQPSPALSRTPYYILSDVTAAVIAGTDAAVDARPPWSPLLARLAVVRFTGHALADPAVLAAPRSTLPAFDAALVRLQRCGDGRGAGAAPSLLTGPDLVQLRLGVAAIRGMIEAFAPPKGREWGERIEPLEEGRRPSCLA
ncbi:hypothetical protein MMPV_007164 [Pyropia vietnamensis]